MPDSLDELKQIAHEMDDLLERALEMGIPTTLERLEEAAKNVGLAASNSWFGYQANVYFRDFGKPSKDAFFSKRHGLSPRTQYAPVRRYEGGRTTGSWLEYDTDSVINTIFSRAGNPSLNDALDFYQKAKEDILRLQKDLLSILEISSKEAPSEFLTNMKQETNNISLVSEQELISNWAPGERETDDERAIRDEIQVPPHLGVLAQVEKIEGSLKATKTIRDIAKYTESHIARLRQPIPHINPGGTRVFLGHGHSPAWWELQDFLQNRLGLPTEEFNRVSAAGLPTSERLSDMMDTAAIAFLVMTGEDEQADGSFRARENVVHEAGLFQGRLGFGKAIILLEEGCREFSNNTGLVHIPFPKNNIAAASEEVRKVLEREGLIEL